MITDVSPSFLSPLCHLPAGPAGSQKYTTMTWAGDQNVDWSRSDGLPSVLPAALSLGVSGVGLTHFDIGLYTTMVLEEERHPVSASLNMTRSEELLLRSAELAAFTVLMRTHEGKGCFYDNSQ